MSADDATAALRDRLEVDGYLHPDYRGRCIANLPDTVAEVLGVESARALPHDVLAPPIEAHEAPIEHVVLVVVDGLGWDRFEELRGRMDPLGAVAERASVTPLTSTYPSETAAAMISLYTGLQPVEHGQLGWFSLFPEVDTVGLSLPFTTRTGEPLEAVHGLDREAQFDTDARATVGERLRAAGVAYTHVAPTSIVDSSTSRHAAGDAAAVGYDAVAEALETVATRLEGADGRTYHLVYYPDVDAAAHRVGTRAARYDDAVERAFRAIRRSLLDDLAADVARRTLVLVVADHGLVDTDPATNLDLTDVAAKAGLDLDVHLRRGADGRRLYPAGSPRNVQLYAAEGRAATLRDRFADALDARVYDETTYRDEHLFGDRQPGARFQLRAPDVVVVPREKGLWYDDGELDQIGMHGGLHPREMLVPLLALRAG
ncbi:MAG: alkaline phosphatase family protein [Halobacteriales archaeon]